MAFWDRFRSREETRGDTDSGVHVEEIAPPVDDVLLKALLGSETIDREKALTLPVVAGAVDFISNAIACMPVKLYREKDDKVEEIKGDSRTKLLNGDTGDTLDAFQLKKAMVTDYLMGKGGYCYIRKYRNEVTGLFYVKDQFVSFERTKAPIIKKDYQILVDGNAYRPYEFIKLLRNTQDGASGVGLTQEISKELETAYQTLLYQLGMVKTGGNKRGFLRAERKLGAEEITALKQAWRNMYGNNTESVVVLNNGLQFQEASNSSVEMQMNESKRTLTDEINDLFHIYPNDFDRTFKEAIYPIVKAFETALNRDLLLEKEKKNRFFELDVKEIIRASLSERYSAYKTAKETGFMTLNEIRRAENLNWIEGLDVVNVGLGAVLYDVNEQKFFTPNTGEATDIESATQAGQEDQKTQDMIIAHEETEAFDESGNSAERELRFNDTHDPKTGQFASKSGGGLGSNADRIIFHDGVKQKDLIKRLADEYENYVAEVTIGANKAGGRTDVGGTIHLAHQDEATAYHEFAHGISSDYRTKVGLGNEKDEQFWKEAKKIRSKYLRETENDPNRWISTYSRDVKNPSEFMAESFAQIKLIDSGAELPHNYGRDTTYSRQMVDLIDKYYKRNKRELRFNPNHDSMGRFASTGGGGGGIQEHFAKENARIAEFVKGNAGKTGKSIEMGNGQILERYPMDEMKSFVLQEAKENGVMWEDDSIAILYKDGSHSVYGGGDDTADMKMSNIKGVIYSNPNTLAYAGSGVVIQNYNEIYDDSYYGHDPDNDDWRMDFDWVKSDRELRFNENHDPKTGKFAPKSGAGGGVWDSRLAEMRGEFDSLPDNKKAVYLWKNGFLSKDDSLQYMKDGSISKYGDDYFQILRENGDYTPAGPTRDNSNRAEELYRSGEFNNYTDARADLIKRDTGFSDEDVAQTQKELNTWFSGSWDRADTATLDRYVEASPTYDGVIHRGMSFDNVEDVEAFANLKAGDRIGMRDKNSSWTTSEEMARHYAHTVSNDANSVVVTSLKNRTSSPVADLSTQGEYEVLASSKSQWTVLRTDVTELSNGNKKVQVYVVEVGNNESGN